MSLTPEAFLLFISQVELASWAAWHLVHFYVLPEGRGHITMLHPYYLTQCLAYCRYVKGLLFLFN